MGKKQFSYNQKDRIVVVGFVTCISSSGALAQRKTYWDREKRRIRTYINTQGYTVIIEKRQKKPHHRAPHRAGKQPQPGPPHKETQQASKHMSLINRPIERKKAN